ncbi:hypothetical protein BH10BAC5_BH10BAC5_24530 [soil metagenome]
MMKTTMKKSLLAIMLIAAFVVIGNNSYAQTTDGTKKHKTDHQKLTLEERATKKTDKLNKKLTLSSDQYKSIYNSILSAEQQVQSLRGSVSDKQSLKDQIKKINITTNETIRGYLTSDQQQKFKGWKNKGDKKHGTKGKHKTKEDGRLGPPEKQ